MFPLVDGKLDPTINTAANPFILDPVIDHSCKEDINWLKILSSLKKDICREGKN
jgi:hypothetical protein